MFGRTRKMCETAVLTLISLCGLYRILYMVFDNSVHRFSYHRHTFLNYSMLEYHPRDCVKDSESGRCSFDALWRWATNRGISASDVFPSNFSCPSCPGGVRRGLMARKALRAGEPMVTARWESIISANYGLEMELRGAFEMITTM